MFMLCYVMLPQTYTVVRLEIRQCASSTTMYQPSASRSSRLKGRLSVFDGRARGVGGAGLEGFGRLRKARLLLLTRRDVAETSQRRRLILWGLKAALVRWSVRD